jgi:hypothetical protein
VVILISALSAVVFATCVLCIIIAVRVFKSSSNVSSQSVSPSNTSLNASLDASLDVTTVVEKQERDYVAVANHVAAHVDHVAAHVDHVADQVVIVDADNADNADRFLPWKAPVPIANTLIAQTAPTAAHTERIDNQFVFLPPRRPFRRLEPLQPLQSLRPVPLPLTWQMLPGTVLET